MDTGFLSALLKIKQIVNELRERDRYMLKEDVEKELVGNGCGSIESKT